MSIVEDGEELSFGIEVLGKPLSTKGVDDGVCRERRTPLLAVRDENLPCSFHQLDTVGCGAFLGFEKIIS